MLYRLTAMWISYSSGSISASECVDSLIRIVPPVSHLLLTPQQCDEDYEEAEVLKILESTESSPPAPLDQLMGPSGLPTLIVDMERRCALQLAWLRKFPKIELPCCRVEVCFKCKVTGHHPEVTCAERQASELSIEAQYCVECGVPTVRSEGCNHIVCVCGAHWTWKRGPDEEDY